MNTNFSVEQFSILKSDDRGTIFDFGKVMFFKRNKGYVGGSHTHPEDETLYLIHGIAQLTVIKETQTVTAPVKIHIAGNVFHKLVAITDIEFIEDR